MERLKALKNIFDFVRGNLYNGLAIAAIVAIAAGYLYFFSSTIGPNLGSRGQLISQIGAARQSLVDANAISNSRPADLQAQLVSAQATLASSGQELLSNAQVSRMADTLYQMAAASGITITELQTQPAANSGDPSVVSTTRLHLAAGGDAHALLGFVSLLKETSQKGSVVNSVNIASDKSGPKLTLDISFYSSGAPTDGTATASPPPAKIAPTATATPVVPKAAAPAAIRVSSSLAQVGKTMVAAAPPAPERASPTPVRPTPTAVSPAAVATARWTVYVVRAGDTLPTIARRYSLTLEAIMAANRMSTTVLKVGQQLIIPGR